jgi:hypothetical protein
MMVGKDDVRDLIGRMDQLRERTEDRGLVRHHPGIDNHTNIAITHEANGAGDAFPDITRKEDPEFSTHGWSILRRALTILPLDRRASPSTARVTASFARLIRRLANMATL